MNKPNATGVRAGSPKNTSAGKIKSITGPRIPLSSGTASHKHHNNVTNS